VRRSRTCRLSSPAMSLSKIRQPLHTRPGLMPGLVVYGMVLIRVRPLLGPKPTFSIPALLFGAIAPTSVSERCADSGHCSNDASAVFRCFGPR
jgi:hypothetical protein